MDEWIKVAVFQFSQYYALSESNLALKEREFSTKLIYTDMLLVKVIFSFIQFHTGASNSKKL